MSERKTLRRSRTNKQISGVCGGIAEYFGWDPTALRLIFIVITVLSGFFPGFVAYLAFWLVMPDDTGPGNA